MGRKRVFNTAKEFGDKVSKFMDYCTENNIYPSDYQLRKYSGIEYSTLYNYITAGRGSEEEDNIYKDYFNEYKKLVQFREDWLLQMAVNDPKRSTIAIFALKQNKNGGWIDKPVVDVTAKELTVNVQGLGNNAAD